MRFSGFKVSGQAHNRNLAHENARRRSINGLAAECIAAIDATLAHAPTALIVQPSSKHDVIATTQVPFLARPKGLARI